MKLPRLFYVVGTYVLLAGCAVGPNYEPPEISVTEVAPTADMTRWWQTLRDPELSALVERAIAANPDIEIALSRVQAARELEVVVVGAALPQVGISSAVAGGSATNPTKGRIAQSLNAGVNTTGLKPAFAQVSGFDASWEIDLFGKYRRELEAARDDTDAAIELRNAVLIATIADVARNYIELRGLQARLEVLRGNISRGKKSADLVQARYDRGLTNELDVTLAKRELAVLHAGMAPLTSAISEAKSRIAVLLGTFSEAVAKELRNPRKIPHTPERVRAGQPVDLLRRRPDIRQAERELAAATARIGVATADLFPRVTLITGLGTEKGPSTGHGQPFQGTVWSFGPGAYWPVLDFGRLDAAIHIAEFQAHELLVNYKKIVVAAVEEVENALKRYRADRQRLKDLGVAREQSQLAVEVANERYERGLNDFLNVLDAQRQEFDLEDQYAVAQQALAVDFVALYKALGGGWELYQDLPPVPESLPAVMAAARVIMHSQ